jgi:hypothetical protein
MSMSHSIRFTSHVWRGHALAKCGEPEAIEVLRSLEPPAAVILLIHMLRTRVYSPFVCQRVDVWATFRDCDVASNRSSGRSSEEPSCATIEGCLNTVVVPERTRAVAPSAEIL